MAGLVKKSLERLGRRVVPSTSLLSHNILFKWLVNGVDLLPRLIWPEFRKLPPNHLRIRIGVGNRFFTNHLFYLQLAEPFWLRYMSTGAVREDSVIVDIGCGCGRFAHHLRDYRCQEYRFRGRYIGIDIDPEMLDWCRGHFDPERFQFMQSTHSSKSYHQIGQASARFVLPQPDQSVDFVFSTSLFTHLLEPELRNYFEETARVLKEDRLMVMSFFCLDYPPPTLGGRHTFSHSIGNARVESLKVPEAAVAYTEAFMLALAAEYGFSAAHVLHPDGAWQASLVARR